MINYKNLVLVCCLMLVSVGCLTPNPKLNTYREARKVAIFQIPKPLGYVAIKQTVVAQFFTGIENATMLNAGLTTKNSLEFNNAVNQKDFQIQEELTDRLVEELKLRGYEVTLLDYQDPFVNGDLIGRSKLNLDQDLILSLNYEIVGYASASEFTAYKPLVRMHTIVIDGRTGQFVDQFHYNLAASRPDGDNAQHMKPSSAFHFRTFRSLMSSTDDALRGLVDSQGRIAAALVSKLRA